MVAPTNQDYRGMVDIKEPLRRHIADMENPSSGTVLNPKPLEDKDSQFTSTDTSMRTWTHG